MPFSQTDNFEVDLGNWTNDTGTDDFDWTRSSGTTPSGGTGAGGGYASTWYIYTETSSPITSGQEAVITSNVINASLYTLEIDFREHMVGMGDGTGYLALEAYDGVDWTEEYRQTGPNGATEDGTDYVARNVDLSGYSNTDFQVRFRLHVSNAGNAYQNDCHLDDIVISGPDANSTEQEGYQWREDNGSESGADDIGAQDVAAEFGKEENKRLRVLVDNDGNPATAQATLQYKRDDEAASEWRDV